MITGKIQAALDTQIAGSPRAQQLLRELEGRSLVVLVRFTPFRVRVQAIDGRLQIVRDKADGDATILGSPLALLAMTREPPMDVIRRGDVKIEGDSDIATRFQELLALLQPDLEESLSGFIGDIPAHGVGSLLRSALAYGRQSTRTTAQNLGEYFTHERRELVTCAEAEGFLQGVDALRETTDRLAARVAQLEQSGARK
jgi:ubiquinone biosynthesis accessory factor UbiJ